MEFHQFPGELWNMAFYTILADTQLLFRKRFNSFQWGAVKKNPTALVEVNWHYTMANTGGWLVSIKIHLRFSVESTQRHINWNLIAPNCCQLADGAENRGWTLCYICGATFPPPPTPHPSFRGFTFIWRNRFNKRHLFYKNIIVIKLYLINKIVVIDAMNILL